MNTTRLFAILLALLSVVPAYGTVYYVSPTGNDANNGLTTGTAFHTYIPARDRPNAGDTVYWRGGIYDYMVAERGEALIWIRYKSGAPGNPVTWASYPGETATIDFQVQDNGIMFAQVQYWKLQGMKFWTSQPRQVRQGVTGMNHVEFDRCEFESLGSGVGGQNPSQLFTGRGFGIYAGGNVVRNCRFSQPTANQTGAAEFYSTADMLWENNEQTGEAVVVYFKDDNRRAIVRRNWIHDSPYAASIQGNAGPGIDHRCVSNRYYENVMANVEYGMGTQNANTASEYSYNNAIYTPHSALRA